MMFGLGTQMIGAFGVTRAIAATTPEEINTRTLIGDALHLVLERIDREAIVARAMANPQGPCEARHYLKFAALKTHERHCPLCKREGDGV